MWKETPIPMYIEFYLFNCTNAQEVVDSKWAVKPKLEECGPYTYSEHHVRVNVEWHDNGTLSYQQKRIWKFLPERTNGSLDDKITNLNVIAAVSIYYTTLRKCDVIKWRANVNVSKETDIYACKSSQERFIYRII